MFFVVDNLSLMDCILEFNLGAAKVAQGLRLPAGLRAPALGPGYPGLLEPKSAQQMDRPRFG